MKLTWTCISLRTKRPFVIARWGYAGHENVIVTITDDDGLVGMGEAAPNRYYGESVGSVAAALERYAAVLADAKGWSLEAIEAALVTAMRGNASARAAVSAALHDLHAKRLNAPLWRVWGLDRDAAPPSSFTIAIDDEAGLRSRVADAAEYPILKIKLGTDRDEAIVRTVREAAPDKVLRVDANAAWAPKHAVRMAHVLRDFGVESIEQPVAANDLDGLRYVFERSPLPVLADESCLTSHDVPRLAGACDGVNLKLAKTGSLREAMRLVHAARAHDLRVMAGCMIETSLGISAIAQLAPLLDAADFDGAALLADDPFTGVTIAGGRIVLGDSPGLGATARTPA
jgi:L-alanine-DL-glutamate epimerase-like enolase superfamily enzyme